VRILPDVEALPSPSSILRYRRQAVGVLVRVSGIALVGALLGYYIITGMPQFRLNPFWPTLTLHAVTAGLVLVYVIYLALRRRLPGGTPVDWPLALMVGAYALATAAAVYWRVSLENMLLVFMALAVFYALSDMAVLSARDLQRGVMLAGAAASLYALWVVGDDYFDWLALARSVGGLSFGDLFPPTVLKVHDVSDHPNMLAMTLILVVPFYALAIYRPEAWWERAAAVVGLAVTVLAVFLTLSRGGWVGGAIGLAVTVGGFTVLALAARGVSLSVGGVVGWLCEHRVAATLLAFAAVAVLAVAVAVIAILWGSRPQWLFHDSLSPRRDALSAGFDMFKDHPLLGTGPAAYALLYPEYSGEFPVHGVHAHNAYLQAAVDLGLPGIAALLALAAVAGWMLWRTVRDGTQWQRLLAVTTSGALAGFLVHGMVDAPNIWKAPLVMLAAVGAVLVRNYREVEETHDVEVPPVAGGNDLRAIAGLSSRIVVHARRLLPAVPGVLVLVVMATLLMAWGRIDAAHFYYARGLTRAAEDRLPEAVSDASQAADMDPEFAIYQLQLGLTEVRAYLEGGSPRMLDQGIRHLRRGVELEPRGALGYANLARALALAEQPEKAAAAALEARDRAGVDEEAVALAAGTVLEDVGQAEDAIETYAQAISLDNDLADSAFWTSSSFREEHYGDILARSTLVRSPCRLSSVLARSPGLAAAAEAAGADLAELADACAGQVAASPNNVERRIDLAESLLALGDQEEARRHLDFAVQREPDNGRARTVLGQWYADRGDVEAARSQWLLAAQLEDAEGVLLLGESYPPDEVPEEVVGRLEEILPRAGGAVTRDIVSVLYYRMKFGRGSPIVMLVPGEWQQAVPSQYVRMEEALSQWRGTAATAE
jgi:O-antigen ligase/tetratricopeptide (TPR) repeat protein